MKKSTMQKQPAPPTKAARRRGRAGVKPAKAAVQSKHQPEPQPGMTELYRRAVARLRERAEFNHSEPEATHPTADTQRLLHELQVHQIELEMQNNELRQARDELEVALENATDLYDFAPAGYFTLAPAGTIQQVNLTGAHLIGIERSRLVGQSFGLLVSAAHRPAFNSFLKQI